MSYWVDGYMEMSSSLHKNNCAEVMRDGYVGKFPPLKLSDNSDNWLWQGGYLHDTEACGPHRLSVCIICLYLFTFALMRLFAYLCVLNLLVSISMAGHLLRVIFIFRNKKRLLNCWSV